ncbi:MAG: hypothetical protein SGI71_04210 [Verrucomicrobiota bacterium]|nr:hypothetical protein [Verrucomicrobiota bacterium]
MKTTFGTVPAKSSYMINYKLRGYFNLFRGIILQKFGLLMDNFPLFELGKSKELVGRVQLRISSYRATNVETESAWYDNYKAFRMANQVLLHR